MLIKHEITMDLKIESLIDLKKLQNLEKATNLKVNKSQLARELNVDRRTVDKYIKGYEKPKARKKYSKFDEYYKIIEDLLSNQNKIFSYKKVLWQYLKDNYGLESAESSFRRYISSIEKFNLYFKKKTVKSASPMRFETSPGEQAQIDWKESIPYTLKNGEVITINILVLIMSYSRFRIYKVSLNKTRETLLHYLNESFEQLKGVPHKIVCDNMTTIMDQARTQYSKGKINGEFEEFMRDYGFELHPCIAGRPQTKAKVEAPMKILDEIRAYNGDLNYMEIQQKIAEINNRENQRFHEGYQMIPILGWEKEKDSLLPLPTEKTRNQYLIKTTTSKVNESSMFNHKSRQYSVAPEYIGKYVQLQIHEDQIHVYYNRKLITIHRVSKQKLNYLEEHYIKISKRTLPFNNDKIEEIAKDNLRKIGELYKK